MKRGDESPLSKVSARPTAKCRGRLATVHALLCTSLERVVEGVCGCFEGCALLYEQFRAFFGAETLVAYPLRLDVPTY